MNRMRKGSESFNEPNLHSESRQDESPSSRPELFASLCLLSAISDARLQPSHTFFIFHQKFNKKVIATSAPTATACSRQCTLNFLRRNVNSGSSPRRHRITIFIKSLSSFTRFYRHLLPLVRMLWRGKKLLACRRKLKLRSPLNPDKDGGAGRKRKVAESSLVENAVREGVVRVCVSASSRPVGASGIFPTDIPIASENEKNFIDFPCCGISFSRRHTPFHATACLNVPECLQPVVGFTLFLRSKEINLKHGVALNYHKSLSKKHTKQLQVSNQHLNTFCILL